MSSNRQRFGRRAVTGSTRDSNRRSSAWGAWLLAGLLTGCCQTNPRETIGNNTCEVDQVMCQVDSGAQEVTYSQSYEEPVALKAVVFEEQAGSVDSRAAGGQTQYRDVTLDEVVQHAMTNSMVLRDLGATLLRTPAVVSTRYQRALLETNPQLGVEAALSEFDTILSGNANFQDNDRIINNRFFGGGTSLFVQDRHDYVAQLSKRAATGAEFAVRSITDYDANNAPANLFGSAWQQQVEGEVRQPLLQGGGLTFNRIAGPGAVPGIYNGVLIAKVNNDANATEFERAMQCYVSEIENAYWDLYFAYRDLSAKQEALDNALSTWERAKARVEEQPEQEPLAREQYYRFHSELQDSLSGKLGQRTQNNNGTTGGTVRGFNGVQVAERRLRLLIGDSVNSRVLLRPVTEPILAPLVWDWDAIVNEALQNRPELRQQRLAVKRRQLELLASRNFLAPRLDAIGRYRVRGLGHNLAGGGSDLIAGPGSDTLGPALDELGTFNHQEWELGVEFSVPLGYRRGHAAVQHAELQIARELAVLHEQERQVVHDLSNAKAEMERANEQREINRARWLAARDAEQILLVKQESGADVALEMLLDAQRRKLEAETAYHLAAVEYEIAEKNVHLEKGSILTMHSVLIDNPLSDAQNPLPGELQFVLPPLEESAARVEGAGVTTQPLPPAPQGAR